MEENKTTTTPEEKKRISQQMFLAQQAQGKIDRKVMLRVKHRVYQSGNFSVLQPNK